MRQGFIAAAAALSALTAAPAWSELVLNQVIVDLAPDKVPRMDIEASNTGKDRIYVVAEPAEIVNPGKPDETRVAEPDPARSGLLVTPQKMILEPGERKLIRIASVAPRGPVERIYRVTVKPVVGDVASAGAALKILVGYDVLVIVRPTVLTADVVGARRGNSLTLTNSGTTNVEIYGGKQCDAVGADCKALAARRLYAGASLTQAIDPSRPVDYRIKAGDRVEQKRF